ncbi:MAG: M42 family metallopeptidase [Anaerolineales bacterium]
MKTVELLEELTAIPALSGREEAMIAAMRRHFEPVADEVRVDRLGNVIATIEGKADEPKLLIFAHMDELGLIVRKIDEDGFLRFERVGGVPEKSLLGTWVEIHTDTGNSIPGLVGTTSHHVTPPEKKFVVPSRLEMYIDIGRDSREDVERLGIQVGDAITYRHSFTHLSDDRIAAKSLDNRVGCALLIQSLAQLKKKGVEGTIYFAATVQEEFNVRGAWPVFQATKPDAAICLDVTIACDTPEIKHLADMRLGAGPAVGCYEFHGRGTLGGLIPNPKLRRFIESAAKDLKIPLQREVLIGIITDAAFSQLLTEGGVPMAALAIPTRYTHASVESCSLRDIEQAIQILVEIAHCFNAEVDLSREG